MTYIKSFLKGFASTFRWLLDPSNKFELTLCLLFLIFVSTYCIINGAVLYGIAFGIQIITGIISYLFYNSDIDKRILIHTGLCTSIIASIFWVIGMILYL